MAEARVSHKKSDHTSYIFQWISGSFVLIFTAQKMKFSIKDFFSKSADLVTFTEEILNGKPPFLCSVCSCDNCQLAKRWKAQNKKIKIKKDQRSVRKWLVWRWNHVLQQQTRRIPHFLQCRNIRLCQSWRYWWCWTCFVVKYCIYTSD